MLTVVVALAIVAPAAPKDKDLPEAAKKELKALEGKWIATKITVDGNDVPVPEGDQKNLEFKGQKFLIAGKEFFSIADLDPSTDPKVIDFKALADMGELRKDNVYEAIYKLDKDTLTIALYFGEGQKRPTKFESEKNSKVGIMTLEREKK